MKRRGSLFGRMLGLAALSTAAALVFAAVSIAHVLDRFVVQGMDNRLDAQLLLMARTIGPDGAPDPSRFVALPGFGVPGSGWVWRIVAPNGRSWRSDPSAPGLPLAPPPDRRPPAPDGHRPQPPAPEWNGPGPDAPRPAEARGAEGERLHLRILAVPGPAGPVTLIAGGPRRTAEAPLRAAAVPLLVSLALLGLGLSGAVLLQLRLGLRPLHALQDAIGAVVAGRLDRVPADQPRELMPLAEAVNALINRNENGLDHARRHVANLAHGLKTPLATIGLKLAEEGRDPDGSLAALLADADRRIVHHLRRARAAAPGGTGRARTALAPCIADLASVLARLHAERHVRIEQDVPPGLLVAVDAQDLDEMLGNLLDNACQHARGLVWVTAREDGAGVAITVADDGPGLDAAALQDAGRPGRRLDEGRPGRGFGLSITRELAELYGGSLALAAGTALPGLAARLHLPASAGAADA